MPSALQSLRTGAARFWSWVATRLGRSASASRDAAFRRREERRLRGMRLSPDFEPLERREVPNDPFGLVNAPLLGSGLALLGASMRSPASVLASGWDGGAALPAVDPTSVPSRLADELFETPVSALAALPRPTTPHAAEPAPAPTTVTQLPTGEGRAVTRPEAEWGLNGAIDDWLTDVGLAINNARQRLAATAGEPAPAAASGSASGAGAASGTHSPVEAVSSPTPAAAAAPAVDPGLATLLAADTTAATTTTTRRTPAASPASSPPPATSVAAAPSLLALAAPAHRIADASAVVATAPDRPHTASLMSEFGRQPLIFEANEGQADDAVRFLGQARDHSLTLGSAGLTLALPGRTDPDGGGLRHDRLHLEFVGADPTAVLRGEGLLPSRSNYFRGGANPLQVTDVANYARVVAHDAYPGIDLVYRSTQAKELEYDFVVRPGADLAAVRVAFHGADSMHLDERGRLLLDLPGGQVVHEAPVLYQEGPGGHRQAVAGRFTSRGDGAFGFAADGYDRSQPLVVDPVLSYATYLGTSATEAAYAAAADLSGNLYLTGYRSQVGNADVLVAKYDPAGVLLYTTYVAGLTYPVTDEGTALAVDAAGTAFVTGHTGEAPVAAFPTTTGAYDTTHNGGKDAFLFRLSPAGNTLMFSTLLGGSGDDIGRAVALTPDGCVVVTGSTASSGFPTTGGSYDTSHNGGTDVFVTKFRPDGGALEFSTFVGGASDDTGYAVAVAPTTGLIHVGGATASSGFPTAGSAYDTSHNGGTDAFALALSGTGASLSYGTFLGGSGDDAAYGLALDSSGRAYLTGKAATGFPTSGGAFDTSLGGNSDAFVARIDSGALGYSTFVGGSSDETGYAVAVDASTFEAYATGVTSSSDFPTASATQSALSGSSDAFVVRLNAAGSAELFGTYLGGSSAETGYGLALTLDQEIITVGQTTSTNFPTAGNPAQGSNGGGMLGGSDAFLAKYAPDPVVPTFTTISSDTGSSSTDEITTDQTLSLSGTASFNSTVTLHRADTGDVGTTTANGAGAWTFDYTATTLAEGSYAFTASGTVSGVTSAWSNPLLVTVDRTAPSVSLTTEASTTVLKPYVRVVATDRNGLANGTTVTLDVDLNNDNDFADGGETAHTSGTLTDNVALLNLATALTVSTTVRIRARVTDKAGNEGTSSAQTVAVASSGSAWTISSALPTTNAMLGSGPLQAGNLSLAHPLDTDLSPGTTVGGSHALVYNSERVDVRPVIQATVQSDNGAALPSTITVQLTWNGGSPQTAQQLDTTGMIQGDLLTVAQQVDTAVTTTGRYPWSLQVTMDYGTPIVRTLTGTTVVVAEDASVFGAGWTLGGADRLVDISSSPAGKLRVFGDGNWAFYASSGGGYTSPAGDGGTLTSITGGFRYTAPDGSTRDYDSSGKLTKRVSADSQATLTYSYDGSNNLETVKAPDGSVTTFSYNTGKVETIQTGSRAVTLSYNGDNLEKVTNPDAGLRTFTYDGARLTRDEFATLSTTYAYSNYALSGWTPSGGGANSITPAGLRGLSAPAGGALEATLTDGLSRTTRVTLDGKNQPTHIVAPGGGVLLRTYDNGWLKTETDALNRTTTLTRDAAGYVTEEKFPDATTKQYAYQTNFHALTTYTDERGGVTTFAYDGSGHRTRETNPLGQATVSTWENGLLKTVTDALSRVTTYNYDASRRLESVKDALGGLFTYTYDSNGNVATTKDPLGRVTTFSNDALGRVLAKQDALGNRTTLTYDSAGLTVTEKDALGRVASTTYDGRGLVTKRVEALGAAVERSELFAYDNAGQQTAARDANGWTTNQGYDAAGRPLTSTDPVGGTSLGGYDLAGQAVGGRDELGRSPVREYDLRGRLTKETDALGGVTSYAYDNAGNLVSKTDARGTITSFSYDALNRQTAVTEALGNAAARTGTVAYDAVGNVSSRTDWLGNVTSYSYDALNRQTAVTEGFGSAVGRTGTTAYDAVGNVISRTDWRGTVTSLSYDSLNRQTAVTEAFGTSVSRTSTVAYDAVGNVTSRTDWLGRVSNAVFDALNRQTSATEAAGSGVAVTTTQVFDAVGRAAVSVDGLGKATQSGFDALGRAGAGLSAAGSLGRTRFDASGNTRVSVDALGNKTETTYDALNRVVKVVDALSGVATFAYDANGNQTGMTDARGGRVTMTYDALNRQGTQTDQLGHTVTTVYDDGGNVLERIDALGKRVTMTYDALNRVFTTKDPLGGVVSTVYDAGSNVVNTINQLGNKTTYVYDELGRRTKTVNAEGGVITLLYDAASNQTGLIDPVGNRTTFVYDALNRKTEEKDPLNESLTYAYDAAGRLTSQTDRLGRRRDYGYDADGRLTSETWVAVGGGTSNRLTYTYDANGNQLTAADQNGAYTWTYDALNCRATQKDVWNTLLTFGYDAVGNRTSVQDSFGGVLTSVYSAANLLTSRRFGGSGLTPLRIDIGYTDRNEQAALTRYSDLAGTTKIGESTYTYDAGGRLTNLQHKNGSGTNIANFTYTYDAGNRVTSEKLNGGAPTSYTYDNTDQLTQDGTKTYSYDANGNRTMAGYQTGAANRMTNDGTYTYTYNDEGSLTKKSKGTSDETWDYGYDHRNQLTSVEKRATDGGTLLMKVTYTYDVFNQRVQSAEWTSGTGTVTARYAVLDDHVWADLDGSSALTMRWFRGDVVDQIFARISAGGTAAWHLSDRLGSVRKLVDGTGAAQATLDYDGYGSVVTDSNPTFSDRYVYTGRERTQGGIYYYRGRWYAPPTGGWLTEDPDRFEARDTHLRRYVRNNPTNATDPSGLREVMIKVAAFIPGHLGTWLPEPGSCGYAQVKGDERGVGGDFTKSRLRSWLAFDTTDLSKSSGGHAPGQSERRHKNVYAVPPSLYSVGIIDPMPFIFNTPWIYDTPKTTKMNGKESLALHPFVPSGGAPPPWAAEVGPQWEIHIEGSGNYPYIPQSPNIDYDLSVTVLDEKDNLRLIGTFRHDGFPSYEVIIDGNIAAAFHTPYNGPGPWNLGIEDWRTEPIDIRIPKGDKGKAFNRAAPVLGLSAGGPSALDQYLSTPSQVGGHSTSHLATFISFGGILTYGWLNATR